MVDLADILQKDALDKRELVNSTPVAEIVAELPLIFSSHSENIACQGLDILKLICESSKEPGQPRLLVSTVLYAFENESPDVHARALEMLKRFASPLEVGFAEELRQRLDMIDSSQRPAALALLATADGATPRKHDELLIKDDGANGASSELNELIDQYETIEERWRKLAGCDEALDAARGKTRLIPPVQFGARDVVRLDPNSRFQSIQDPDELIDLLMRGFKMQLTEAEIERVLDGVSRTPRPQQGDYWDARLAALRARAKNESSFLSAVALAWAFGIDPEPDQYFESLLHKRVISVANQLAAGQRVILLATPTHTGFWIDPRVLVERAGKIADVDAETMLLEQVQALLRIAPEHRRSALSAASTLKGEFGSALRYALGSDEEQFGADVPLWVAAIRARLPLTEPYCMKIKLVAREYPLIGGCLSPSSYQTESANLIAEYLDSRPASHEMVALIGDMDIGNIKSPLCTEVFWARQFREVSESRESSNNYWQEDGWEQLFDPDLAVGGMAMHALVYGLNAICSEARSVSVKILIRAIQDGRIDGVMLGATIAHHYSDLLSTLWLEGLNEVALATPLHSQVVHCGLETICGMGPVGDESPDSPLLLELLALCKKIEQGIASDTAKNYLDTVSGGGVVEKLAKELLAVPCLQNSIHSKSAGLIALKERIKRANRWQAWHSATSTAGVV